MEPGLWRPGGSRLEYLNAHFPPVLLSDGRAALAIPLEAAASWNSPWPSNRLSPAGYPEPSAVLYRLSQETCPWALSWIPHLTGSSARAMHSVGLMPPCCFPMIERYISCVSTDDAGQEDPAAIRRRLQGVFTPGFARRATILGLIVGGVLHKALGRGCEAVVYGSVFGETRALGDFLDSFCHPSPTLFQTSVHPSAVQQLMIDRHQPVREYIPLAGGPYLPARMLVAALLTTADSVVLCGGEEKGGWLAAHRVASDRSFAFALTLCKTPDQSPECRLRLQQIHRAEGGPSDAAPGGLAFSAWFESLHARRNYAGMASPEWWMELEWT